MTDHEREYAQYVRKPIMEKDLNELEGLLRGIAIDGRIENAEVELLRAWCTVPGRAIAATVSPFDELIPKLEAAIADGVLDDEERQDILWLCERSRTGFEYFDVVTADMQRLHGVLAGIVADRRVTVDELRALRDWLDAAEHLRSTWPYDEVDALISHVLADGKIDQDEHRYLLAFCRDFARSRLDRITEPVDEDLIRHGVCASCPEVEFEGRTFCITGSSPVMQRRELEGVVSRLGGIPIPRVRRDLNYLVVAAERTRAWAFSCYGRKVEAAVKLRREGLPVVILHESDFWDAAADLGVEPGRIGT